MFRRRLAARVLHVVGVSTVALPVVLPACSGGYGGPYGGGYGGAIVVPETTPVTTATGGSGSTVASSSSGASPDAGATTSATTSGSSSSVAASSGSAITSGGLDCNIEGLTPTQECFSWPTGPKDCPTTATAALAQFSQLGCPSGGYDPCGIESLPLPASPEGECCYMTDLQFCVGTSGRPFIADDGSRVAAALFGRASAGWTTGSVDPSVAGLCPDTRASLAAAWTADALAEHASVASFARVSLSLLAAGAPAELVAATHRAALDEIRHAELCFALASAYAGEPVGPGAFPIGPEVHVPRTLAELALGAFAEGCVNETVSAVIAAEQHAHASDPAVRAALAEIAADEARHAELAWKTVAWALAAGGRDVFGALAPVLEQAIHRAARAAGPSILDGASDASEPDASERAAHGRIDDRARALATTRALREIVAPAASALLAAHACTAARGLRARST